MGRKPHKQYHLIIREGEKPTIRGEKLMSKNRKNTLVLSLAENVSIIDMKYGTPDQMSDDYQKELKKAPKLVTIDYLNLLPNPPANNSPEVRQELIKMQKEIKKIKNNNELENMVKQIDFDADWTLKKVAKKNSITYPQKMLDKLWRDVISPIQMQLKWKYNRPRPYQLGKKLGINIDHIETRTHHSPAYPSGHAIHAYFSAFLLESMFPKVDGWMKAAKEVPKDRIYQGVHFPRDGDAAIYIAKKIWDNIKDKYKTILT